MATQKKYKKPVVIVAITLLIVISAYLAYTQLFYQSTNTSNDKPRQTNDVDYGPPTNEELAQADKQKDQNIQQNTIDNNSSSQNTKATITISDIGVYNGILEVRSFITNHYEDGNCKYIFTKNSSSFEKLTKAYKDATTTICTNPLVPVSEFPAKGTWNLQIEYKAPNGSGTSELQKVEIK